MKVDIIDLILFGMYWLIATWFLSRITDYFRGVIRRFKSKKRVDAILDRNDRAVRELFD